MSTINRHRDDLAVSVRTKPAMLVLIGSDRYILNESDASQAAARVLSKEDTGRPMRVWVGQRLCTADGIPIIGSSSRVFGRQPDEVSWAGSAVRTNTFWRWP